MSITMKKFALALFVITLACVCGVAAAQAAETLTLTPSASTVPLGGTITLTATVSGTSNTGLTWSVNGVTNGNATTGTLGGSGLKRTYTAPRVNCPSPNPVTFKIVSAANSAVSKTATVTVTDTIAVTLSPSSKSLPLGGTQAFTAAVSHTSNTALKWYVNGVLNGNAAEGTLTGTGSRRTYKAPPVDVPNPNPAVIKVASAADPAKYKTATVTVTTAIVVKIISPPVPQTVKVGQAFSIKASLSGSKNTAVTWSVNGVTGGNSTYGKIAGSGLTVTYTAPKSVPSPATYYIKVASQADPSKSAALSVTVKAATPACPDSGADSLLRGQYAFSLSGFDATGYLALVGSFTADGSGLITGGVVDSNGALGSQAKAGIIASESSYSVGSNHMGCATIATTFGTFNTRVAVGSITSGVATAGRVVEWDNPSSKTYLAATGQILQQTASSFKSAIGGRFAFKQFGYGTEGVVGAVSAAGGAITAGEADSNASGTYSHKTGLTGSYTVPDSNGRFTIIRVWPGGSPSRVVGYVVSASHVLFMPSDTGKAAIGEMAQQTGTFGAGSLNGHGVFYVDGLSGGGEGEARIGILIANGAGSISVEAADYDGGEPGTWGNKGTCSYSVEPDGRVWFGGGGNCGAAMYLMAPNTGFVLIGAESPLIGNVEPQVVPSGGFSDSSFSGTYFTGDLDVASYDVAKAEEVGVSVMTMSRTGGTIISDYTALASAGGQQGDHSEEVGTLAISSNGTFATNSDGTVNGIMISSTKSVVVDNTSQIYPVILVIKQ